MSEFVKFVKKTLVGYKEAPGGRADPECTHVILTLKEYEGQLQRIAVAEQEARTTKHEAEKTLRSVRGDAQYKIQAAEAEAAKMVAALEGELEKERQESAYQRGLNKNLLRISRERANADRKLKPKKEHTGYFVVFTGEKEYRFKKDRRQWGRALLWETILQSPYSIDFSEEQARKQIKEDFFEQMGDGSWMIARLGFDTFFDGRFERLVEREDWESKYKMKNVLLRPDLKLRAGFRSGYWEVIILHTKALGIVPPEMRAQ